MSLFPDPDAPRAHDLDSPRAVPPARRGSDAWAALPDALTSAAFVAVWLDPTVFGALSVKTAALTMLVEFLLVHATGFFTALAHRDHVPEASMRRQRWGIGGVLCGFYLLMIGAFAWSFGAWWPLLAFAWLVVGKVLMVRAAGGGLDDDATFRAMAAWAFSVVCYLGAAFATVAGDIPTLGMPLELQPTFGFDPEAGGLWIEEPHRAVAMGALYFALLAAGKLAAALWRRRREARMAF